MYSLILFLAAVVGERKKSAAAQAAEEDDHLQAEMVHKSNEHYRELIKAGGRNVVKARQVLSTPEQAKQQEALLSALEGGNDTADGPFIRRERPRAKLVVSEGINDQLPTHRAWTEEVYRKRDETLSRLGITFRRHDS
jgi:hypothetical protein